VHGVITGTLKYKSCCPPVQGFDLGAGYLPYSALAGDFQIGSSTGPSFLSRSAARFPFLLLPLLFRRPSLEPDSEKFFPVRTSLAGIESH